MSYGIECPTGAGLTNVAPGGVICAYGPAVSGGVTATQVQALVVQNFTFPGPPAPPAGTPIIPVANGAWGPAGVGGAVCGPKAAPLANTLIVWFTVPTTTGPDIVTVTLNFMGVCAAAVDCCDGGSGFGSGSGSGGSMSPMQAAPGSIAVATAPLLWAVLASGFEAGKALFNGPWALNLRPAPSGVCVWDNGSDGADSPLVELQCESPIATTWRLTFRQGTDTVVEYALPATEWNPLGANVVTKVGNGVADGTVPDHLTVTPG